MKYHDVNVKSQDLLLLPLAHDNISCIGQQIDLPVTKQQPRNARIINCQDNKYRRTAYEKEECQY